MQPPLSKDTRLCISLAARPSNIGTRFHNYLYDLLGLDFIYKAFTTTDIAAAIGGVRGLGIRGHAGAGSVPEARRTAAAGPSRSTWPARLRRVCRSSAGPARSSRRGR